MQPTHSIPKAGARAWRILAVLIVTSAGLVGCGGASSPTTPSASSGSSSASTSSGTGSPSSPSGSSTSSTTTPACSFGEGWTTTGHALVGDISRGLVGPVRVGRHDCYDRVVLVLSGTGTVGARAKYVDVVHADPSDRPLPVVGAAVIQLTVQAASRTGGTATGSVPERVGDYVYTAGSFGGWASLRAIRLAGNFEAVTTFAIGVERRLPFRLFSFVDASTHERLVVLDVAHR